MNVTMTDRRAGAEAPPAPGAPRRGRLRPRPWWAAVLIALFVLAMAADLAAPPRRLILGAVPDTLRALGAAVLVFGVTGFGVVRLLLPASLRRHELLWILPTGACVTGLALTLLGFMALPFGVAVLLLLAAGAALCVRAVRHDGAPELPAYVRGHAWPAYLAAVIVAVALIPMVVVMHFATVTGVGSDAVMSAGTGHFLQHEYPTGTDVALPVDHMPLLWKSKYPIYYAFGAVSWVAGLETWQVLTPLIAVLLALGATGLFLVARDLLGATLGVAILAMGFAGLARMTLHTGLNPYFNQTWGYMAMPFALVLGWVMVRPGEPFGDRRRTAGLLALFFVVLLFAYPLAAPIPAIPILAFVWLDRRRRRREGEHVWRLRDLYHGRRSLLWMVPVALLLSVPAKGVIEKFNTGAQLAIDPRKDLSGWAGDMLAFIPFDHFLNLPDGRLWRLVAVGIVVLAFVELRRQPRAIWIGLGGVLAFALFEAAQFRQRDFGWYFHFKLLAFTAPLLLVAATIAVTRLKGRWPAVLLAAFAVATAYSVREEVYETGVQLGEPTVELAEWAEQLPEGASVRLDMTGPQQLWAAYFLAERPVCSQDPLLGTDYPRVPISTNADYVVVQADREDPGDVLGPPLRENLGYRLYRRDQSVAAGPENCSREAIGRVRQSDID